MFVRAFYYIPSAPVNDVHLFSAIEASSPYLGVNLIDAAGGSLATGDSVAGGGYHKASMAAPPTDRWFCLEWQIHVAADSSGYLRVWLDGGEATDLGTAEPTNPPGGLSLVSVGYEFYNPAIANPAGDAWIDEVVVDAARIGCAQ
jgi:hypothetical protein